MYICASKIIEHLPLFCWYHNPKFPSKVRNTKMLNNYLGLKNIHRNHKRWYSNALSIANILHKNTSDVAIQIKGWVKSIRKMKDSVFFDVSDGSCDRKLQVIIPQHLKSENLTTGCSIVASGRLSTTPKGQLELKADHVEVLGSCVVANGYPFSPKKTYAADYVRQYLHFRPRTNTFASLLRIRDAVNLAVHEHLHDEGFINVHAPILTSNDCEGAGEIFTVNTDNKDTLRKMAKTGVTLDEAYFNSKVFLTVSGQLHLEAVAHAFSKVYTFGPTFRAENSRSRLHLSEFYMLEAEVAFVDELEELCEVIEKLMKTVGSRILNNYSDDLERCRGEADDKPNLSWLNQKFHMITYDEAVSILNCSKVDYNKLSSGFSKEEEIFLVRHFGDVPVFVVMWPKEMKPFYMKECNDDLTKVAALDLLGPNVGEIVGGSLRENNYGKLEQKIPKGKTNLDWYLELRRFGSVPTGGFGLGFERFLQLMTGISNIKDTIPFPRWPHNCSL